MTGEAGKIECPPDSESLISEFGAAGLAAASCPGLLADLPGRPPVADPSWVMHVWPGDQGGP